MIASNDLLFENDPAESLAFLGLLGENLIANPEATRWRGNCSTANLFFVNWVLGHFREITRREMSHLSVMVMFENAAAGWCANEFLDWVLRQAPPNIRCYKNFWMLNLLRTPLLQEQAAVEASRTDMILISLGKKAELPGDIQEWLGRWLDHKEARRYWLGMLHQGGLGEADSTRVMRNQLRNIAESANTEFFCWNPEINHMVHNSLSGFMKFLNQRTCPVRANHEIRNQTR